MPRPGSSPRPRHLLRWSQQSLPAPVASRNPRLPRCLIASPGRRQVLAGIDLDSGQRQLDNHYKLSTCIKIARLYLVRPSSPSPSPATQPSPQPPNRASNHHPPHRPALSQEDDDALSAEAFIKKAAPILSAGSKDGLKDEALELQYKTCYARILDSKARRGARVRGLEGMLGGLSARVSRPRGAGRECLGHWRT